MNLHNALVKPILQIKQPQWLTENEVGIVPFKAQLVVRQGAAEESVDIGIVVCTGVMTSILIRWIKNGKQQAPDDLVNALGNTMNQMVTLEQLL